MSCKPTYKGIRYNSLKELYEANQITPQQKQQAQIKFQEYINTTGRQDIEGFKEFVQGKPNSAKPNSVKPGVEELFSENPELANDIYSTLGFNFRYTSVKFLTPAIVLSPEMVISVRSASGRSPITVSSRIASVS